MYTLATAVVSSNSMAAVDMLNTTFGIRRLRFDSRKGCFLNDRYVKVKGLCNHQDFGGVGTAVPDRLQMYRVETLKAMGGNAWRCAHNPPNPELLDATDALGMLVWDENRVYGPDDSYDRVPTKEVHALGDVIEDVQAMVVRDRNHPSVIWW